MTECEPTALPVLGLVIAFVSGVVVTVLGVATWLGLRYREAR